LLHSFFCFFRLIAKPGYLIVMTRHGNWERGWRIYLILTLLWIGQQLFVTLAIYLLTGPPFSNYFKSSSRVTWLTSLFFIMLLLNCCHDNSRAKT
jgi:hypothetical protein